MAFEKQVLTCTNCGAPIQNLNPRAKTSVCPSCGAQLDLTSKDYQVLGHFQKHRIKFPINIGWEGTYQGEKIRVIGHIRYAEQGDKWDEFLLISEGGRTLWLQIDEGKPTFFETITPLEIIIPDQIKTHVKIAGRNEVVVERGYARIVMIDGELTWKCKKNDSVGYIDTQHYSIEYTDKEIEVYEKIPTSWKELKQIFGKLNQTAYTGDVGAGKQEVRSGPGAVGCITIIIFVAIFLLIGAAMSRCGGGISGGSYSGGRSSFGSSFGGK